jgi:integrase/recombinase XerD
MPTERAFPHLLQAAVPERLMHQRPARPHTLTSSRHTFWLLLQVAQQQVPKAPSSLSLAALAAPLLRAFLEHLEQARGHCASRRKARLAARPSFFHYAALYAPPYSALIQRVLAIPSTRTAQTAIAFFTRPEIDALLEAPRQAPWTGRRDRTFLLVAGQTGLRVSALTGLQCQDVVLGTGAQVPCCGTGRKERCTPLRQDAAAAWRLWRHERQGGPVAPVFPQARGGVLSRDGGAYLLAQHVATARQHCHALPPKRLSPHGLRHTAAMALWLHGVARAVIALWLGHASVETTQRYVHAKLELQEQAFAKTTPLQVPLGRYRPDDQRLAFLKGLSLYRVSWALTPGNRRVTVPCSA